MSPSQLQSKQPRKKRGQKSKGPGGACLQPVLAGAADRALRYIPSTTPPGQSRDPTPIVTTLPPHGPRGPSGQWRPSLLIVPALRSLSHATSCLSLSLSRAPRLPLVSSLGGISSPTRSTPSLCLCPPATRGNAAFTYSCCFASKYSG